MSRSAAAGIVIAHRDGVLFLGLGEGLHGLAVRLVGLDIGGAGLGDLGVFLGLVLGFLAQEGRQVAALDEELGHLHQGVAGLGSIGVVLDEVVELVAGVAEQVLAEDQVVGMPGLVDERPAFLVIEADLEVGGQRGIVAELSDVIQGDVVQAVRLQGLEERDHGARVLVGLCGCGESRSPRQGDRQDQPAVIVTTRRDMTGSSVWTAPAPSPAPSSIREGRPRINPGAGVRQ